MHGLKVGHFSDHAAGTGASVFLFESQAVGGYWICGAAPATHEVATLDPAGSVPHCQALVLTGGSAYGLHAAAGVNRYLAERQIGHPVPTGVVPIVPAAALYDLAYKTPGFPSPDDAYQACLNATEENIAHGRIGAGTGATVGKLVPGARCMTGGLGRYALVLPDGLEVIAYVAVNSVGDVWQEGAIMAGACDKDGHFVDCEKYILAGHDEIELFSQAHTTLAAIFTNAALDKAGCLRMAKMAAAGLARAIKPVSTGYDGDIVFCFSLGAHKASELTVGTMAAEALRLAIVQAVTDAEIVDG